MIAGSAGWSEAGGLDGGTGDTCGASFAEGMMGPVGGACTCGCVDEAGASGSVSAGAAGTGSGVAGNVVSALVSLRAVLSRCHRLGSVAAGFVMPASGDMT